MARSFRLLWSDQQLGFLPVKEARLTADADVLAGFRVAGAVLRIFRGCGAREGSKVLWRISSPDDF